jgi:aminoglycoside phosphotransferase (APT) family kinase protein
LWWQPHDVRFDFDATSDGAGWIDDLARVARARLCHPQTAQPVVVGHFDWRVENLGLAGPGAEVIAIYDWDSLAVAPEAIVVGNTAAQFTADWASPQPDPLPTMADMRAFVADYEEARGASFDEAERDLLDAANLALCAYGARCQHSDLVLHPAIAGTADSRWLRLLQARGEWALLP